ncbi:MAG TPA: hypothetical protein EYF98_15075 [Planctomycetes bacterium]|jgi:hypothetical protein|nr:hypothetical protein [Planctomycetota bacterium]
MVASIIVSVIISALMTVLSALLAPDPGIEDQKLGDADEFLSPTNIETRVIPINFGTNILTGPNVIWYGNLRANPIRQDVGSWISSDWVVVGYEYYASFDLALCKGPIDGVSQIRADDKPFIQGGHTASGYVQDVVNTKGFLNPGTGASTWVNVNARNIFGGHKHGGGLVGSLRIYWGELNQERSAHLYDNTEVPQYLPSYSGLAHIVWQGGYIGERQRAGDWDVRVHSYPNPLNLAQGKERIIVDNLIVAGASGHGDANPVNCLYEILTNSDYGLGLTEDLVDLPSFQYAAELCFQEKIGFSYLLQKPQQAAKVVDIIKQQISCALYQNEQGKFQIKMVRDDYDIDLVPSFDSTNIVKMVTMARTAWNSTKNSVHVEYVSNKDEFTSTIAVAQDLGNIEMQGGAQQLAKLKMPGVRNSTQATTQAHRALAERSQPLVALEFTADRSAALLSPGDVISVTDPDFGLNKLPLRVAEVSRGSASSPTVLIKGTQDIFAQPVFINTDPAGKGNIYNTINYLFVSYPEVVELVGATRWEVGASGGNPDTDRRVRVYITQGNSTSRTASAWLQNTEDNLFYLDTPDLSSTPNALQVPVPFQDFYPLTAQSDSFVEATWEGPTTQKWQPNTAYAAQEIVKSNGFLWHNKGDQWNWSLPTTTFQNSTSGTSGDGPPPHFQSGQGATWGGHGYVFDGGTTWWTDVTTPIEKDVIVPVIGFSNPDQGSGVSFHDQTQAEIRSQGYGLFRIGDEIMAYTQTDIVQLADGDLVQDPNQSQEDIGLNGPKYLPNQSAVTGLSGIYRGLFDTDITDHAVTDRVWFWDNVPVNGVPLGATNLTGDISRNYKIVPKGLFGRWDVDDSPNINVPITEIIRSDRPLRPAEIGIQGLTGSGSHGVLIDQLNGTGDITVSWTNHSRQDYNQVWFQNESSTNAPTDGVTCTYEVESVPGAGFNGSQITVRTTLTANTATSDVLLRADLETAMGWVAATQATPYLARVTLLRVDSSNSIPARVTPVREFRVFGDA